MMFPRENMELALRDMPVEERAADGSTSRRALSPLETGQVGSVRRIARLVLGLPGDEIAITMPSVAVAGAALAASASAAAGTISTAGVAGKALNERRVMRADVLDQGDESEIEPMGPDKVRALVEE